MLLSSKEHSFRTTQSQHSLDRPKASMLPNGYVRLPNDLIQSILVKYSANIPIFQCHPFSSKAKGRTNVELREQFTLAPGVSQGMATFKPKMSISGASPDNSVSGGSGQRLSVIGPIMKVRLWVRVPPKRNSLYCLNRMDHPGLELVVNLVGWHVFWIEISLIFKQFIKMSVVSPRLFLPLPLRVSVPLRVKLVTLF